MQDSSSWRDVLKELVQDTHERQRIANEVNVSQATLMRWVHGESMPRPRNLRMLLKALPPQYQRTLSPLLSVELQKSLDDDDLSEEIPSIFYRQVIRAHVTLPQPLHFSSICDTILLQALMQLDANRSGMEITIVQCMPPIHNQTVRSLRESIGRGTPPLSRELEQRTIFLGAESLAGYAITNGRPYAIQSREEGIHLFPVHWVGPEESAMACPIMRCNTVAGCLLVSSIHPNYFVSPTRRTLVENYADLLVLAFEHDQFYPRELITLYTMPPYEKQRPIVQTFRNRVIQLMVHSQREKRDINIIQAEQQVWQEIEQELLNYFLTENQKERQP